VNAYALLAHSDLTLSACRPRPQEHTLRVKYPACSRHAGRTINQSFVIMDLRGLSLAKWNAQTRDMLKQLTGILSDHYPETMGALFIINAPGFFTVIWSVAQVFLDPGTKKKITILGSNYRDRLFEHVDPSNLPTALGGTDDALDILHDQGPWVAKETATLAAKRSNTRRGSEKRGSSRRFSLRGRASATDSGNTHQSAIASQPVQLAAPPPPPPPPQPAARQRRRGFLCCIAPDDDEQPPRV